MNLKNKILVELTKTNYPGMFRLCDWLEFETDFFEAPASTSHHYAFPGGLAKHSWCVFDTMKKLDMCFDLDISLNSMRVTALLHDVCKTNYYKRKEWSDPVSKVVNPPEYVVADQIPLGHGEKSLALVAQFLRLSIEEACAIRWHMGAWTSGVIQDPRTFNQAAKYPLVTLLVNADNLSSRIIEEK